MWYWIKFFLIFLISCFFLLPLIKVEDPFRSLCLRFFSNEVQANLYQHDCNPDRVYLFEYDIKQTHYKQRYDGYVKELDDLIPEDARCKGVLSPVVPLMIRYFPLFAYWSEPILAIRLSLPMFLGVNLIKFLAILILIWTFLRRN